MINLSASLLKDILQCSMRGHWRIKYPELSKQTGEMHVGDVVHKVLEESWDKLDTDYDKIVGQAIRNMSLKDAEKVERSVKNYLENFRYLCEEDDIIEEYFRIKLDKYSGVFIVGKMDRISKRRGMVIDWKTSPKEPPTVDNDIQFILYSWAFEKMYGKKPNMVGLANLSRGRLVKYNENPKVVNYLFSDMIPKVLDMIEKDNFTRDGIYQYVSFGNLGTACSNCSFRNVCLNAEEGE